MSTRRKLLLYASTVLGLGAVELRNPSVAEALPLLELCGVCYETNDCPLPSIRTSRCISDCGMSEFESAGSCEANDPGCGGSVVGWWCGGT